MTKAVLFDLDGTLLDTEESILSAFNHAFATHALEHPSQADIRGLLGLPIRDMYKALAPDRDTERMVDAHREFQRNNLHLVRTFPHVLETLTKLRDAGIALAVVTSRLRQSTHAYLHVTNLHILFDVIVTGDDVKKQKPDPEPVRHALDTLALLPDDTWMVGDTFADIGAGKNAGVRTIGVLYGHQGESIRECSPDHLISSFAEIPALVLP